jgi:hypothetical protein
MAIIRRENENGFQVGLTSGAKAHRVVAAYRGAEAPLYRAAANEARERKRRGAAARCYIGRETSAPVATFSAQI